MISLSPGDRGRAQGARRTAPIFIALVLAALGHPLAADTGFEGTVTKIFDGDSFLVRLATGADIDVRLADIDAPEKQQPYGDNAAAALQRLIADRRVYVEIVDTDQYARKVARVYRLPDRMDIARNLVHDGHVWVRRKYARDHSLFPLEDSAQAAHMGLWSLPATDRVPPWQFRYRERQRKQ